MTAVPVTIGLAGVDATTLAWGLATQLGDAWLLGLLALSLYWLGQQAPMVGGRGAGSGHGDRDTVLSRDRIAVVVAGFLLAIALTAGLKAWFAAPRPGGVLAPTVPDPTVDSVVAWLTGAQGHGFPSGHGVGATVVWGGLAWAVRTGSVRARAGFAAIVLGTVGLSRVALGVHTPWQVLAGIGIGLAILAAVLALATPVRAFALAAVAGVVATVVLGPLAEVVLAVGLAVGAAVAWIRWGEALGRSTAGGTVAFGLGLVTVLPVLAGLVAVQHADVLAGVVPSAVLAPALVVLVGTGAGVALVVLPLFGRWIAEKRGNSATVRP